MIVQYHTNRIGDEKFGIRGSSQLFYFCAIMLFTFALQARSQIITIRTPGEYITGGTFSPDGKTVRTTGGVTLRTWNASTGSIMYYDSIPYIMFTDNPMYSANGKFFSYANLTSGTTGNYDENISVFDSVGKYVNTVTYNVFNFETFLLSPYGSEIAVGASPIPENEGGVKKVVNGQLVNYPGLSPGPITYSGDGILVVYCSNPGLVVADANTGKIHDTLSEAAPFPGNEVFSAYFNSTGEKIIATYFSSLVAIWDVATGKLLDTLPASPISKNFITAFFSPNDSLIFTLNGDSSSTLWDANTLAPMHTLKIPGVNFEFVAIPGFGNSAAIGTIERPGDPSPAAFSPDGTRIFTAHSDNTLRVWNVRTGKLLHTLAGHIAPITSAIWDSSGTHILTTSMDSTAKIWGPTYTSLASAVKDESHLRNSAPSVKVFPDPVTGNATLEYQLNTAGETTISVFNVLGENIHTLKRRFESAGVYDIPLNLTGYTSGVYFVRLDSGRQTKGVSVRIVK